MYSNGSVEKNSKKMVHVISHEGVNLGSFSTKALYEGVESFHYFHRSMGAISISALGELEDITAIAKYTLHGRYVAVVQAHVMSEGNALWWLHSSENNEDGLNELQRMAESNQVFLLQLSFDQELILVPVRFEGNTMGWIMYALPLGSVTKTDKVGTLVSKAQLALVLGVEHTLMCSFDLVHRPPPREVEFAMLSEFDHFNRISLPGGHQVEATQEESGPTLRLQSPEGELVLSKIPVKNQATGAADTKSMMVHIRPGWVELRAYLLNQHSEKKRLQLFRTFACFKGPTTREEATEIIRLLDPDSSLFGAGLSRVYYSEENSVLSLRMVLREFPWDVSGCCIGIDNSTKWDEDLVRIWPVRPYSPYSAVHDYAGLAGALHAIHNIRNMFFEKCEILKSELSSWISSFSKVGEMRYRPLTASLDSILSVQKHRWLQEFQAPQSKSISKELACSRDYVDPMLRNKWHLVVDTNVFHNCAADKFEFFKTLEHTHSDTIVMVIPFVTLHELDWQKHHVKKEDKLKNATDSIHFINAYQASNSTWIVVQSVAEDAPFAIKHKDVKPINAQNDMRVFECAKSR